MFGYLSKGFEFLATFETRSGAYLALAVSKYLTANQVTALSSVSILGSFVMAQGGYSMILGGAILFYFGRWLDFLDGPVARHTGVISEFGQHLDSVITAIAQAILFIGLGRYWGGGYEILGLIGGALSVLIRVMSKTRPYLLPPGHPSLKTLANRRPLTRMMFDAFGCLPFWWLVVFAACDSAQVWFVGSVAWNAVGCVFFAVELFRWSLDASARKRDAPNPKS